MGFNEPFLVNPPKRHRGRFSFRSMLSKLGNPRRRKARKIRRHTRRARKNPLADLMIMNAPKKRRKIISRATGRGENKMARRKRRSAPKKHRVTLLGRRVSKRSRIARRHRGFLLNPPVKLLNGILPSGDMIQDVLGITAGYVAVKLVPKYVFPIVGITEPAGIMGTVSKVGVVVAVGMVAGFLKKPALRKALITGGLVAIAIDLLGQTGVLADGMGYILPPERLNSYQIPTSLGEEEDSRR